MFKRASVSQKGFTLVELLSVIVILGILVAIMMPGFAESTNRARLAEVKANAHTLQSMVEAYNIDNGIYPAQASDLVGHSGYKTFPNPFTNHSGPATSGGAGSWWMSSIGAANGGAVYSDGAQSSGLVIYVGLDSSDNATTSFSSPTGAAGGGGGGASPLTVNYVIYGCDKWGQTIPRFLISAGQAPANAKALVGM